MSDELTNDQISQWLEVAAPCLFAAWQYGQTPDDADPVAWFAEVYGQGAPGPVHAVHVVGDDGRTVAVTGNGPRSEAHAKFVAWSSPGNVSKLLRDFRAMRERAIAAERLLSDERAAHAETSRDLDALLTALGAQVTPGGQTEDACHARRVADGLRRARELVAAREVPADVEAAIRALVDGVHFCALEIDDPKAAEGSPGFPGWPDMGSPMVANLRAAIAAEIERARAEGRAESPAAPATVGGLLGSFPIVEWRNGDDWFQARIAQLADGRIRGASLRWRHVNASAWSTWGQPWGAWEHMTVPARIVLDASEADADPASRGPIGGGS